jgi:hypothetical protein
MKREMDLIRDLMLHIEGDPVFDGLHWVTPGTPEEIGLPPGRSMDEIAYHLGLLLEAGFVKGQAGMQMPMISQLTWKGHEFLDDIRDQDVWSKTKDRLGGRPSASIGIISEIARAELKKKLRLP